ncbi:hemerythrin domain-containing protein [Streptomyces calidiresistens]|uniref:Hemerythrin domain-containing protein n=1 Tax=Streptomyces calidiresistens TaxID=1485586 RepID=A0A7W3SZ46_9ACTN|nr:hemerythrin domain-containing protein [Streptomyces calidiresistens]MBB0227940.1 hemerythrin domain-containing protein [Streptomyces calidiresistens]
MCECRACRAPVVIGEPTREHDTLPTLIARVRDAHREGEVTLMAELARRIAAVLEPHAPVGEGEVFPPPAGEFPGRIPAPEAGHCRVEAVLSEADGPFLRDPTWPGRLIETLDLLGEHIKGDRDGAPPVTPAPPDPGDREVVGVGRPVP